MSSTSSRSPRPATGPGQVVVAVVTAATNPGEIGIREGHFAAIWPAHFPKGQGNDFAGYVAEIGSGVHDFAVGNEVLRFAPRAAQAEYVALNVGAPPSHSKTTTFSVAKRPVRCARDAQKRCSTRWRTCGSATLSR